MECVTSRSCREYTFGWIEADRGTARSWESHPMTVVTSCMASAWAAQHSTSPSAAPHSDRPGTRLHAKSPWASKYVRQHAGSLTPRAAFLLAKA